MANGSRLHKEVASCADRCVREKQMGQCQTQETRHYKWMSPTRNKTLEWYIRIKAFKAHVSRRRVAGKRAASTQEHVLQSSHNVATKFCHMGV